MREQLFSCGIFDCSHISAIGTASGEMSERMNMLAKTGVYIHNYASSALCYGSLDRRNQQNDRVERDAIASLLSKLNIR